MKLNKFICFFFLLIVSISCSKNKVSDSPKTIQKQNLKIQSKNQKVVIKGTSDDSLALKFLNVMDLSYFIGTRHKYFNMNIENDSLLMVLDSIKAPQTMRFVTTSEKNFYDGQVFVEPGDTIVFEIKNKKMVFNGKKAIYNNFYTLLYESTPFYHTKSYKGDINKYKQSIKSIYDLKLEFLNEYINEHKITSDDFIHYVEEDFKQEYLFELINPRNQKVEGQNMYFGTPDELESLIIKEYSNKEIFFDFSEYFNEVSLEDIKKPELVNNLFLRNNINNYIRNYFISSELVNYSQEKLLAEKEFIQSNFNGDLELYAIARMINDYHYKGFGNSVNNIEFFKLLLDEYEDQFTKPSYKELLNDIKQDLDSYNFVLSDAALESKIVSQVGDTLTLKDIFARSKKRIKVVDFWASWCPPCITQIKEGKPFKDKLTVEDNVEWIYLSIDKEHTDWLKKSTELAEFLNFSNSYYIINGKDSSLGKSLKVGWIPRYVILNEENKIILNNAPTPSQNKVFEKIIKDINSTK